MPESSNYTEEARADGALFNALTGLGVAGKDKTLGARARATRFMTCVELENLYTIGLPRRFVDAVADEVLKHKVSLKLGGQADPKDSEIVPQFNSYLRRLKFHRSYASAVRLQRLYGGAGLLMLVDDGRPSSEPIDFANIRRVNGFAALSRYELVPRDFTVLDTSNPTAYQLNTNKRLHPDQVKTEPSAIVHSSRVARFDGLFLPWNTRQRNQGWGQAPLEVIWSAWKRYESATAGLENIINDSSVFWHKIPGLFQTILDGNTNDLMKRMAANNLARSSYGGYMLDSKEEIGFSERSLSNFKDSLEPFSEFLQATTGWPASILMGSSPGGLGKEGRFEERVWAAIVEKWQTVYCQEPLEDVFNVLMHTKESPFNGRPLDFWELDFPSVYTQTDKEKAELRKIVSEVDNTYVNNSVLSNAEIRRARFGGAEYSIETALDVNDSLRLEQKTAEEHQLLMLQLIQASQNILEPPQPAPEADPASGVTPTGDPDAAPTPPEPVPAPPGAGEQREEPETPQESDEDPALPTPQSDEDPETLSRAQRQTGT